MALTALVGLSLAAAGVVDGWWTLWSMLEANSDWLWSLPQCDSNYSRKTAFKNRVTVTNLLFTLP